MKKSDLVSGKHIVETKDGERYLVAGDYWPHIYDKGFMLLSDYTESLFRITCFKDESEKKDISRIYEIILYNSLGRLCEYTNTLKLIWERKPELSEVERVILENVDKEYKWIAKDRTGKIYIYKEKPVSSNGVWSCEINKTATMHQFGNLFKMIDFESWEPTLIADLLAE